MSARYPQPVSLPEGGGHSPYLKAVLAAGYAQHQARQAQMVQVDAPMVENPEQDVAGWRDWGKSKSGKGSYYQRAKGGLSWLQEGAKQATDDAKDMARRGATAADRMIARGGRVVVGVPGVFDDLVRISDKAFGT